MGEELLIVLYISTFSFVTLWLERRSLRCSGFRINGGTVYKVGGLIIISYVYSFVSNSLVIIVTC